MNIRSCRRCYQVGVTRDESSVTNFVYDWITLNFIYLKAEKQITRPVSSALLFEVFILTQDIDVNAVHFFFSATLQPGAEPSVSSPCITHTISIEPSGHAVKFWLEECMMFEFHQPSHSNSDFRILSFDAKRVLQAVGVSELNTSEGWYRVQRWMKSGLAMKSSWWVIVATNTFSIPIALNIGSRDTPQPARQLLNTKSKDGMEARLDLGSQ